MWILDSCARSGIELWDRDGGTRYTCIPKEPQFYLHLPDPHAHRQMLEALESNYPVRECTFRTVFGELTGYRITAGRDVAEAIERQSRQSARLYNVDIRPDQKYLAEHGLFPAGVRANPGFHLILYMISARCVYAYRAYPARRHRYPRWM